MMWRWMARAMLSSEARGGGEISLSLLYALMRREQLEPAGSPGISWMICSHTAVTYLVCGGGGQESQSLRVHERALPALHLHARRTYVCIN